LRPHAHVANEGGTEDGSYTREYEIPHGRDGLYTAARWSLIIVVHILFIVVGIRDDSADRRVYSLLLMVLPEEVHCPSEREDAGKERKRWEEGREEGTRTDSQSVVRQSGNTAC